MLRILKEQLIRTPRGKYLTIYGNWTNAPYDGQEAATEPSIEHGELKAVDWEKDTVMLHNAAYDTDTSVNMNQAFKIDDTYYDALSPRPVPKSDFRHDRMVNWYPHYSSATTQK